MVNTKPKKNIENEILFISSFIESGVYSIICPEFPIDQCELEISRNNNENCIDYNLELKSERWRKDITFRKLGFDNGFNISSGENIFTVPPRGVTEIEGKSLIPSKAIKGKISSIQSSKFSTREKSFYRLVLKVLKSDITIFLGSEYQCGKLHYALGYVKVEINNTGFNIFRHKDDLFTYLVIDSCDEIIFEQFREVSDATLQSIGLLTGNWDFGEHFFFISDSLHFETSQFYHYKSTGESILTGQELINPQQFRGFIKSEQDYPELTPLLFPESTLAKLISHIISVPQFDRAVELLITGNEIESPLIKCSVFSVALETIVSLIHSQNKKFFEPIKRSQALSTLLTDLQSIVDNRKDKFSETEYESLSKKIFYLNTPFNKDKYLLAFKFYNIELPEIFIKLLNTRNLYFHGKTPYTEGTLRLNIKELHYEADRLHLLVAILILKYIGYTGHIKNHAAYNLENKNYYDDLELEVIDSPFYRI